MSGTCYIVVGGQYGDEGKGKIAAFLVQNGKIPYAMRCGVGPNAGHGVWIRTKEKPIEVECRHIPAGFVNSKTELFIAPGMFVDPEVLEIELSTLEGLGIEIRKRLRIDPTSPVIERRHKVYEKEGSYLHTFIGSMGSGCGKLAAERALRSPEVRFARDIKNLSPYITVNVSLLLINALKQGKDVLLEGTQGFGLSLTHGQYPFTTSKDTTASQCLVDAGIPPGFKTSVYVCIKPYTTRAGMGPLEGENDPSLGHIAEEEVRPGVVIGKKRRIGLFDWVLVSRALVINGATDIAVTNLDRMWPEDSGKTRKAELSKRAREFIDSLEDKFGIPVTLISTGPLLHQMITKQ